MHIIQVGRTSPGVATLAVAGLVAGALFAGTWTPAGAAPVTGTALASASPCLQTPSDPPPVPRRIPGNAHVRAV
jgi:hypothetical protein